MSAHTSHALGGLHRSIHGRGPSATNAQLYGAIPPDGCMPFCFWMPGIPDAKIADAATIGVGGAVGS